MEICPSNRHEMFRQDLRRDLMLVLSKFFFVQDISCMFSQLFPCAFDGLSSSVTAPPVTSFASFA